MKMTACIIWQYLHKKVQIKIINSQHLKFLILAIIILFQIFHSLINLHIKIILKVKTRIIMYLRIDIKRF